MLILEALFYDNPSENSKKEKAVSGLSEVEQMPITARVPCKVYTFWNASVAIDISIPTGIGSIIASGCWGSGKSSKAIVLSLF